MSSLSAARTTAINYLDEIAATLRLRQHYHDVIVTRREKLFQAFEGDAKSKEALEYALKDTSVDGSALCRGLIVQVNSAFEFFVHNLTNCVINVRAGNVTKFSEIDKKLQNSYLSHAGTILTHLPSGSVQGQTYDFDRLLLSLGKCLSDGTEFHMESNVFVFLLGNCTVERLSKLFSTLQLDDPFGDPIGKNSALQRALNEKKTRNTCKLAKKELNDLIKLRNEIAHGNMTRTISVEEVHQAVLFYRAYIEALAQDVERLLGR